MRKAKLGLIILLASTLGAVAFVATQPHSFEWFVEYPLPLQESPRFFDMGVVDVNGDNILDIYTSNHHFRQVIWIGDGHGGYRDVVSKWGLDQSRQFPLAELSFVPPVVDKPGLYIYWIGTQFIIRAHKPPPAAKWHGSMRVNDFVDILRNDGFSVQKQDQTSPAGETIIEFSPQGDSLLRVRPNGQGLPINFELSDSIPLQQVYVGRGKVSPDSRTFSLAMKDRHALAWADYNNDGILDAFISRGALGGTLRQMPPEIERTLKDEFLVSQEKEKFSDMFSEVGFEKKDCSGRHVRWLDVNHDGSLDLYVNCYDRKQVKGNYPKQLYQQDTHGKFQDVAMAVGIGIPDEQIGSFAWIDVDDDGDVDLVTFQDEGIFLYRNDAGKFFQEPIYQRPLGDAEPIGYSENHEWFFDGKLTVSDFDSDGDLDLFSSSKRGNVLLVNEDGQYVAVPPITVGLPEHSLTGNWVDFDNDGLPDLHTVPQGIFKQRSDHKFESIGLLSLTDGQYQAAVCNWADLDNDGRQDVVMALYQYPSFKHWWQSAPERRPRRTWFLTAYRNIGAANHWLQVKLVGGARNRQGIGARVTVFTSAGKQTQEVGSTDGAFFSQGHYRLNFGLGPHQKADAVTVRWSDGRVQTVSDVTSDQLLIINRNDKKQGSEK